jgi:hypothetical protein
VPGPGSYEYEGAVFKYGSKQEPSYGFGSRLAYNTDGYDSSYAVKSQDLEPMSPKRKFTHISEELLERT